MSRARGQAWIAAALLGGLSACASASRETAPSQDSTAAEVESPLREPLASDPYVRRPGGLGGPVEPEPPARFVRPSEPTVLSGPRPRFVRPLSVGVVLVHEGAFADPATLLLELEAKLARDEGVRRVVAVRGLVGEALDLDDLAALAAKQGHDALLVDVLPGPEGALREGFWLHPGGEADARLIAHVVVRDAEAGYVGPPTFPDVWDRLATAHCRLPAPRR